MKTKIIGFLAIIIAIGASAFTAPKHNVKPSSYYWFSISDGVAKNAAVPAADALYVSYGATPPSENCSGSTHQCVSGFTSAQVSDDALIDDNQTPAQQPSTQN